MTQPVTQDELKEEMETLAKSYVTIQACAIDSLIKASDPSDPWHSVYGLSLNIADSIRQAIDKLCNVYHLLGRL